MIVYQESKKQFLYDVKLDLIEDKIEQKVREKLNKKQHTVNIYLG